MTDTARPRLRPVQGLRPADLPKPPARRPEPTRDATAAAASPATAATTAVDAARRAPTRPIKRSATAGTLRAISISLPFSIATQTREHAKRTGVTHAELLMDAIVATRDKLDDLVEQLQPRAVSDSLFVRAVQGGGEAYVGVSLRMRAANVDVLDRLAKEHHAASRSQLCTAALKSYLSEA